MTPTQGTNISVSRSGDGKRLAIDLVTAIWVLPASGGAARTLTDEAQDATLPSSGPGNQIAFQSYRDGNFHLWSTSGTSPCTVVFTEAALDPLPSAEATHWWHRPEWSEHVCREH